MNAADVMMLNVITVSADADVRDVAKILVTNRISAVPVVDEQGKLVGSLVKVIWSDAQKLAVRSLCRGGLTR